MGSDYNPPTPPTEIPGGLITSLTDLEVDELREVSHYAEALAEHKERERRLQEAEDNDDDQPEQDTPDDVPSKATLTIKTINDNRYYYWQWREGDDIKSKYKGPVNPAE